MDGSIYKNNEAILGKENSKDGINTKITETINIVDVAAQEIKDKENVNNISREDEAVNIEDHAPQNDNVDIRMPKLDNISGKKDKNKENT